ncbi:16S rRNA (guanine(966)-N(2))-methyltransferase RsmD [Methylococcaceae bacterium WWC4]|nr:16S rRNA (guanine(966)-N(2))-methyltransferase RsmD [Methylococcaceae bacterium WWC4]
MANRIRIIGGQWRGRQILFDDAPGLRPTPSRIRETLFNWLQLDVAGSRCLDLYAGSGALGFEAASRGAKEVWQVENHPNACRWIRDNAGTLAASSINLVERDVSTFLQGPARAFDLAFLDPPFGRDLAGPTCELLETAGWLSVYAKIYVETESNRPLPIWPDGWRLLKAKTAGEVAYSLLQRC